MVKEDHRSDVDSKDKLHTLQDWGSKDMRNKMQKPPGRNLSNDHSFRQLCKQSKQDMATLEKYMDEVNQKTEAMLSERSIKLKMSVRRT